MKKLLYSFVVILLTGSAALSQQFSCATDHYHNQLVEQDPTLLKDLQQLIANGMVAKSGDDDTTVFIVPVVFHILHQNGPENIPDERIFEAMEVINRDYRKLNADTNLIIPVYDTFASDVRIEFRLASYDPWGNCTNGIDRIYTHETNVGDAACKLNQWDRSRYLNIWVVKSIASGGAAGYALYPTAVNGYSYWLDGIVALYDYVGYSSPSSEFRSRTLTHEIGHWLALPHVWGSTNDPGVACGDDGIDDTPITKGHSNCNNLYPIDCDNNDFTNAVYTFNDVTTTSGVIDTTAPPSQVVLEKTRVEFSNFEAVGVSANSSLDSVFAFTDWGVGASDGETDFSNLTGSVNTGKYYEFTLTPTAVQAMTFTDLSFRVARNNVGTRTFVVRSSVDNFAANLPAVAPVNSELEVHSNVFFFKNDTAVAVNGAKVTFSNPAFTKRYEPITFRIYAYNAESTSGTFEIDNVTVTGKFGSIENVQNYMEYSYCTHMFTKGQVAVMRHALQSSDGQRMNLITPATQESTGVDLTTPPVCVPIVDIRANTRFTCVGENVTFTDQSYNGPVTFREWSFQDGTPATSTAANPIVSFNSFGMKTVTLTVGNESGQVTKTFTHYIDVQEDWAAFAGPTSFDLEPETQYQQLRYINDGDTYSKFEPYPVGYNSNRSLKLTTYKDLSGALPGTEESRYYSNLGGQIDAIITPSFDLRYTSGVTFSFDYSYATNAVQSSLMTEKIRVYYSRNCGATWAPIGIPAASEITGAALASAGFAGNIDFIPASDDDWSTYSANFNAGANDNRTRFKIEFVASDYSNNLYIDNIRILGTLGLEDDFATEHNLLIAPNPVISGSDLNIEYLAGNEPVTFTLRNLQGEAITSVVRNEVNQPVSFGLEISENIAAAYYFLEVKSSNFTTVKKIAVIK